MTNSDFYFSLKIFYGQWKKIAERNWKWIYEFKKKVTHLVRQRCLSLVFASFNVLTFAHSKLSFKNYTLSHSCTQCVCTTAFFLYSPPVVLLESTFIFIFSLFATDDNLLLMRSLFRNWKKRPLRQSKRSFIHSMRITCDSLIVLVYNARQWFSICVTICGAMSRIALLVRSQLIR